MDITGQAPHLRTRAGLARTFQNIRVFRGMTVLENVMVGAERPGNDVAGQPGPVVERALAALDFVGRRATPCAPSASFPTATSATWRSPAPWPATPSCSCWTNPPPGLNMTEKGELGALLRRLKGHGLTILIVDHDMHLVESVADHITVLNFGRRIADGLPQTVLREPDVIAAYLGVPRPTRRSSMKLLELNGVEAGYGAGPVLKGLTIEVGEGEIVALLGSNGAGKSTTLRSISGLVPSVTGDIVLAGKSLRGMKPEAIVRRGHRPRARGPPHLPGPDRAREHPAGGLQPQRRQAPRAGDRGGRDDRLLRRPRPTCSTHWAGPCPAASCRWSPSPAG